MNYKGLMYRINNNGVHKPKFFRAREQFDTYTHVYIK